ncbi:uncharacterized protein LOC107045670 [Diachasma alloeum]|uniref:uncharacterized protein LOC107044873 n=1 Tax=Diachasma alloeum TaxID=454923 RepID=UPI000738147D|nr:uncharacterized protein LOC107044873 [Diachasma alloeum]XP_015123488.1 uncharacterized protein LOC107045670 [Diachasma alloeum]
MEEEQINFVLTSDEEFDQLEVGDTLVDVTGAIIRIDEPRLRANVTRSANHPYRCIFSNLSNRLIRILFWGRRIAEFEGRLMRQSVRITRGRVNVANPLYRRAEDNLMSIEIFIQAHRTVSILGPMPQLTPDPIEYVTINWDQIGEVTGPVTLTGYIKLEFASVITNNSTYGSGILTDAVKYRLPVYVTSFEANGNPALGSHVTIRGTLRRNDNQSIVLQIPDMAHIHIKDDILMTEVQMRQGFRVSGRNRAATTPNENTPPIRRSISEVEDPTNESDTISRPTQRPRLDGEGNSSVDDQSTTTRIPNVIGAEVVIEVETNRSL